MIDPRTRLAGVSRALPIISASAAPSYCRETSAPSRALPGPPDGEPNPLRGAGEGCWLDANDKCGEVADPTGGGHPCRFGPQASATADIAMTRPMTLASARIHLAARAMLSACGQSNLGAGRLRLVTILNQAKVCAPLVNASVSCLLDHAKMILLSAWVTAQGRRACFVPRAAETQ